MHSIFLLKTIAQLSLILVISGIFRNTFDIGLANFATIALCVAVLWISLLLRTRHLVVRLLPLLLLGILIPFAGAGDIIFVVMPIAIFAVYIAAFDLYTINNDSFRTVATIAVIYICITGFASVVVQGARLEFTGAAIVCGILLSRNLRHDIATLKEPAYMILNLSVIGLLLGTLALAGTGIIRRFIQLIFNGIAWIYLSIIGRAETLEFGLLFDLEELYYGNGADTAGMEAYHPYLQASEEAAPIWLMAVGFAQAGFLLLVLVIVVVFGIWIAKKIFMVSGKQKGSSDLQREYINVTTKQETKVVSDKISGYSGVVRRYYQRFIKLISKRGGHVQPRHTSQDMEDISFSLLGDRGQDLREVYIRARYSHNEISKDDTHQARDAYRRLKEGTR